MKEKLLLIFTIIFIQGYQHINAQTFESGNIGSSIPDNQGLLLNISVSGLPAQSDENFGIESVCFDIQHQNNADLIFKLIAPDSTEVVLAAYCMGQNFSGTCFNGTTTDMIFEGTAPFNGDYRPNDDLGKFNYYKNLNGTWKLLIIDTKPGTTGIINNWSLTFSKDPVKPFTSSNLPIMIINTNKQYIMSDNPINVHMGIIYNGEQQTNYLSDTMNHYNGKATIRYRGNSSMMFPKKGYALDTETDTGHYKVPLLGMPSEHKWVLYAAYNDKTLLRNAFTYQLYAGMGHYSVRAKYLELVINGNYQGVYLLVEKIKRDKNRVNISKLTPENVAGDDLTGGYIIKIDRKSIKRDGWYSKYPSNSNNDSVYFQYVYPENEEIQQVQKDYIRNYFQQFESALMGENWKDPQIGYRKFIDLQSFHDNFIINELSRDIDGYRLSAYFYKDKDSKYGKIMNGPMWDYDMAWYNANFGEGNKVQGWQYQFGWNWQAPPPGEFTYPVPFWWRRFMEDPSYVNELNCRYQNLRLELLTIDNLYRIIDDIALKIKEGRERNFQYWPIIGKWVYSNVTPVAVSYDEEIQLMKDWIKNRLLWMDSNLPGNCPDVGIEDDAPIISSVSTFPNPFSEGFAFNYYIRNAAHVNIELVNSLGMNVQKIYTGVQSSGLYTNQIHTNDLPGGIYLLMFTVDDKVFTKKVIKN